MTIVFNFACNMLDFFVGKNVNDVWIGIVMLGLFLFFSFFFLSMVV